MKRNVWFGCAIILLVVSSIFRVLGAFGWVVENWFDLPILTMVTSIAVAAVPGFGWWASYSALSASMLGPVASGVVLIPSAYGEVMCVISLVGILGACVSKE